MNEPRVSGDGMADINACDGIIRDEMPTNITRIGDRGAQGSEGPCVAARHPQVGVDGSQANRDDDPDGHADGHDHDERRVPAPEVREEEARGDAQNLAGSEGGLDEAHDPPAHLEREQVGRDGKDDRPDHAAEDARDHAGDEEERIAVRDSAQLRGEDEAGVEEEQEPLAVEAVREAGREDARRARAEGVDRDHEPELAGRDVKRRHQHCAERRQRHEVEDDGELQKRQQGDDELLVTAHGGRRPRLA
jgi:hypothetical protein